jgi:N-methylhydantoinase A/oxoprolinase/acetone carboxylase beta subunit
MLARGVARDPRVRAHLHNRAQRVADACRPALCGRPSGEDKASWAGRTAYLVQSNGGAASHGQAGPAPVNLLLSGPSGGVLAAQKVAAAAGRDSIVAVDMGGTSYDITIIQNGRRPVIAQGDIDGLPVRVPMVDMRTIGAGGGSVIWLDSSGRL